LRGVRDSIQDWLHYDLTQGYENIRQVDDVAEFWDVNDDGYIPVQLPGYQLFLDPDDPGISTDILSRGIREFGSYYHYRQELRQLPDDPLILEAGANIGYYALAAAVERPDTHVICVELDAENVERLRYNAEENNLTDRLTIKQAALSNSNGSEQATTTEASNLHSLHKNEAQDTTTVNTITGDEFLNNHNYTASDIDCLRMDVEGHELAILQGLTGVQPAIAHIEIHPPLLNANEYRALCDRLTSWDITIVGVYKDQKRFPVDSIEKLPANNSIEVVFADID